MSLAERKAAIAMARKNGWTDAEILKCMLQGEYGGNDRRKLIVELAADLGLEPSEALRIARGVNLVPTTALPRKTSAEKLPHKSPRKTS